MITIDTTPIPNAPILDYVHVEIDGIDVAIPDLDLPRFDERTGCARAHRYLAGQLSRVEAEIDLPNCPFYQRQPIGAARCTMNGCQPARTGPGRSLCLFADYDHPAWQQVQQYRLLEYADGQTAICRAADAQWIAGELAAETGQPVAIVGHLAVVDAPPDPYYHAGL